MEGKPTRPVNGNLHILISHKLQQLWMPQRTEARTCCQPLEGPAKLGLLGECSLVSELHRKGSTSQFLPGVAIPTLNDQNILSGLKRSGIQGKFDRVLRRLKRNGNFDLAIRCLNLCLIGAKLLRTPKFDGQANSAVSRRADG